MTAPIPSSPDARGVASGRVDAVQRIAASAITMIRLEGAARSALRDDAPGGSSRAQALIQSADAEHDAAVLLERDQGRPEGWRQQREALRPRARCAVHAPASRIPAGPSVRSFFWGQPVWVKQKRLNNWLIFWALN